MLELGNVLKANLNAEVTNAAYNQPHGSREVTASQTRAANDAAIVTIRNPLHGDIADIQHRARNAAVVISLA